MLTVIICTFNRSRRLDRALRGLAGGAAGDAWELLVVDNNSTDATRSVAEGHARQLPLRYVFEPRQGLSAARNRALAEAKGDTVIFVDDDMDFSSGWRKAYADAVRDFPDADYFGGRVVPAYERGRPSWLKDESLDLIAGLLGHYDLGPETRWYRSGDPLPIGGNFGVRRRLFATRGFREDLGVTGNDRGRGEDSEYIRSAIAAGSRGVYVGAAWCAHWFDQRRLGLTWLYRYGVESGIAARKLGGARAEGGSLARQASFLLRGLYQLARGRGDRFRQCLINVGVEHGMHRVMR